MCGVVMTYRQYSSWRMSAHTDIFRSGRFGKYFLLKRITETRVIFLSFRRPVFIYSPVQAARHIISCAIPNFNLKQRKQKLSNNDLSKMLK